MGWKSLWVLESYWAHTNRTIQCIHNYQSLKPRKFAILYEILNSSVIWGPALMKLAADLRGINYCVTLILWNSELFTIWIETNYILFQQVAWFSPSSQEVTHLIQSTSSRNIRVSRSTFFPGHGRNIRHHPPTNAILLIRKPLTPTKASSLSNLP